MIILVGMLVCNLIIITWYMGTHHKESMTTKEIIKKRGKEKSRPPVD